MARGNEGWGFVKVGETYQYKEDWWIARIKILEDNSTPEQYSFKVQVIEATESIGSDIFEVGHSKTEKGYYSGMAQIYEQDEYMCTYRYQPNSEQNVQASVATDDDSSNQADNQK